MMRDLPHLASRLFGTPLLIDARKLDAIVPAFVRRLNGADDDLPEGIEPRDPGEPCIRDGVALVPIIGTLVRRKTALEAFSGLTSYGDIKCAVQCALDDARAKAILLDIDTCGGEATGCFELCDWLYQQRGQKPIWAVADVDALSAGYAIMAQADRAMIAPSGSTGSVGAVAVHCERSQLDEALGITYTVIRSGLRKAELNQFEPLTRDAAEKVQGSLDRMRGAFVDGVVRARPVLTRRAVLATEGQWYEAPDAVQMRLVDGIATLDDVLKELAGEMAEPPVTQLPMPAMPMPDEDEQDDEEMKRLQPLQTPEEDPDDEDEDEDDENEDESTEDDDETIEDAEDEDEDRDRELLPEEVMKMRSKDGPPAAAAESNVVALEKARKEGLAEARALAAEITDLCKIAGKPGLANEFFAAGKSVADVRKALLNMRAEADETVEELSNHQPPKQAVNVSDMWDKAFGKARAAWGPGLAEHFR